MAYYCMSSNSSTLLYTPKYYAVKNMCVILFLQYQNDSTVIMYVCVLL